MTKRGVGFFSTRLLYLQYPLSVCPGGIPESYAPTLYTVSVVKV